MDAKEKYLIHLEDIYVRYPLPSGGTKTVLNDIDFRVRDGELLSVVGPTGCGKSTLLRLILGSEKPVSGTVLVDGKVPLRPDRTRGIVFQKYSLFPHLTALENIMLGLEFEHFNLPQRLVASVLYRKRLQGFREEAAEYLSQVGLTPADAEKYQHQLSGGMRQRVAIAQALIMKPRVLLMDEPFGALDDSTRQRMQAFLLDIWEKTRMTIFFVTHDLEEALFLGTRIIALSQYYTTDDPRSEGSKIVLDEPLPVQHPKPNSFKYSPEFNDLLEKVRTSALKPDHRQHIRDFDLRHPDAWRTVRPEEVRGTTS